MESDSTSSVTLEVIDAGWHRAVPGLDEVVQRSVRVAGERLQQKGPRLIEVGVTLTDDDEIRELNRRYRNQDKPTNVLSFPSGALELPLPEDAPRHLGDIVVALGVTRAEAVREGKKLVDHLSHLVVHWILHLLGMDHEHEDDALAMEAMEVLILAQLGITDPYAIEDAA